MYTPPLHTHTHTHIMFTFPVFALEKSYTIAIQMIGTFDEGNNRAHRATDMLLQINFFKRFRNVEAKDDDGSFFFREKSARRARR